MNSNDRKTNSVSRLPIRTRTQKLVLCALCAALIAIGGFVRINLPGLGVSFTAQTFVVLLAAVVFGPGISTIGCAVYIALGLTGIPIFTRGGGPMYVLNYEFGYLLGMAFSAAVCGVIARKFRSRVGCIIAGIAGVAAVYIVAVPYIYMLTRLATKTEFDFAGLLAAFMLPFLPLDLIKAIVAALGGERLARSLYHPA